MKKCCSLKLDKYLDRCIYWDLKYEARQISSTTVSIENYENQFFISNFTHIHVCMFRLSFLTALNIYKDYFKGRHKVVALVVANILWSETIALVHLSLKEVAAFVRRRVLWPKSFLIFIVWINWRTLLPISFSSWCVSHVLGFVHQLVNHILGAVH